MGYGNASVEIWGPGKPFRIPICSGGSCVYCLNKAFIWISVEGTNPIYEGNIAGE